jgi:cytochrome P450
MSQSALTVAVTTTEFRNNPYPVYAAFLDVPGWQAPSGYRVFSRYADVMAILRQPAVFGQEGVPYPNFHVLDPPDHTRIRNLVAKAFTPKAAARHTEKVTEIVDELIADVASRGSMDLMTDFALRLPARVAADLLDVPIEDASRWHGWLYAIAGFRGRVRYVDQGTEDEERAAKVAAVEAAAYFDRLIAEREATRGNDIVSALLDAHEGTDRLSRDEVLFTLVLILAGGLHTTASQIGNTVRALLEQPPALERVVADPTLNDGAVDEALRYDGSLQVEYRVTRAPAVVGDVELAVGAPIMIVNAAANRDPAIFPDPDVFDVGRRNAAKHLTFGWGIHRCLGAQLAQVELRVATTALTTCLRGLRLDGPPVQHSYDRWRGLASLPVAWDRVA